MDGITARVFGLRVGVRTNDPSVLAPVVEHFPPGWRADRPGTVDRLYSLMVGSAGHPSGQKPLNILFQDTDIVSLGPDLGPVLAAFESDLQLYVAESAPRRIFVHAGVVGWRGRAILVPGRSFSGKTTLVMELVRAGATYYSDEYAVLDMQGRVHPFARPLGMRGEPTSPVEKLPVEALGGRAGRTPLQIGLVVMSSYRDGARWRPTRLSAGQGALALLSNTVSARRQPQVVLPVLQRVVSQAPVLQGKRGDAREAVASILKGWPHN